MPDSIANLFELQDIFLMQSHVRRDRAVPEQVQLNLAVTVNVTANKLPELQVAMGIKNPSDQPLVVDIQIVALFQAKDGVTNIDRQMVFDFVNQKASPLMWPYADMTLRQLTAMMSVPVLKLLMPLEFNLPFADETAQPQPSEQSNQ